MTSYHIIFLTISRISRACDAGLSWTRCLARGKKIYFPLTKFRQRTKHFILNQNLGPTGHGELDSRRKTFNDPKFFSQSYSQTQSLTLFLCFLCEILENIASTYHASFHNRFSNTSFLIFLLFSSVKDGFRTNCQGTSGT